MPDVKPEIPFDVVKLRESTEEYMANLNVRAAIEAIISCVRDTNLYISERAPWASKDEQLRAVAVRTTLEAVYIAAIFLSPYLPNATSALYAKLHTAPKLIKDLSAAFDNLAPGTPVDIGDILFAKVAVPESNIPSAAATPADPLNGEELEKAITEQGNKVRQLKEVKTQLCFENARPSFHCNFFHYARVGLTVISCSMYK